MRDVVNRISLDLDKKLWNKSISVKKNDTLTRTLCITLTKDGEVYPLDNILLAGIRCIKPDSKIVYNDCVIAGNEIRYLITNQTICAKGTVECEVELSDVDGKTMTTPQFRIEVYDTLFDNGELESSNEYGGITQVVAQCEQAKNQCISSETNIKNVSQKITEDMELSSENKVRIEEMLNQTYQNVADSASNALSAANYAENAGESETKAKESEDIAKRFAETAGTSEENASNSAMSASESEENVKETEKSVENYVVKAQGYLEQTKLSAELAEKDAQLARSYSDGGSGTRQGEETDNAKHYSEIAGTYAEIAEERLEEITSAGDSAVQQLKEAINENVANFSLNMETGHLEYTGGTFTFICDEETGHLLWEVTV